LLSQIHHIAIYRHGVSLYRFFKESIAKDDRDGKGKKHRKQFQKNGKTRRRMLNRIKATLVTLSSSCWYAVTVIVSMLLFVSDTAITIEA